MNTPQQHELHYRNLVRTVRAFAGLPLVAATVAVLGQMAAGPDAERAGQWASVVIGTCVVAAGAAVVLSLVALRDLRRATNRPADESDLARFVKDVIAAPALGRGRSSTAR